MLVDQRGRDAQRRTAVSVSGRRCRGPGSGGLRLHG